MENSERRHLIFALNILTFLLTLHTVLPVYINSSYLSTFIGESSVGLIYSLCSLLAIIGFSLINHILRKYGNYKVVLILLTVEILTLLGVMIAGSKAGLVTFFALNFVSISLLGFTIDIFLESASLDKSTGNARGLFLTAANIAWVIASLITSTLLTDGDYWKVYGSSALLFIPIIFLLRLNFKTFKDKPYRDTSFVSSLSLALKNKNLRSIYFVAFLLQFFYAWMTIYTPLYLHSHIGFSWQTIGIIFSVMLLPFLLTELPLGRLADSRLGEKELLCIGFIIIALSTTYLSFVESKSVGLWMAALFATRIGASIIEIMSETYFFKKIGPEDSGLIGVFRTARPAAYVVSPLIGTALLSLLTLQYIFAALGIILLLGVGASLVIEDTK